MLEQLLLFWDILPQGCAIKCKCGVNQRDSGPLGYACVTVFFFLGIFLECCQFFTFGAKAFRVSFLAILLKKSKEKKSLMQILGGKLWQKNQSPHHFSSDPTCGIILQNNFFCCGKIEMRRECLTTNHHHLPPQQLGLCGWTKNSTMPGEPVGCMWDPHFRGRSMAASAFSCTSC